MALLDKALDKAGLQVQWAHINSLLIKKADMDTVNNSLAEAKASGEFDGVDGVSIEEITQTTTSDEDGGENVLTISTSDGNTSSFTVKNGSKGPRGKSILKVTTTPSAYTTAIGDFTPKYRIALSTVIAQSGVSEVYVGDLIQYAYYHYLVGYVDDTYAYIGALRTSLRGSTGAAGTTPVKGTDYFTDADIAEMVTSTKASMPVFTLVGTDTNDVTHTYVLYGYNSEE